MARLGNINQTKLDTGMEYWKERTERRFSPLFAQTRTRLKELFEGDMDLLVDFAVHLIIENAESEVRRKSNRELGFQVLHAGKFNAEFKQKLERLAKKCGADDPYFLAFAFFFAGMGRSKSIQAKAGAKKMLAKSPKQLEKSQVRECWDNWQRRPTSYSSTDAFALDMLDKYKNLSSQAVIARWCRQWRRESATQPAK